MVLLQTSDRGNPDLEEDGGAGDDERAPHQGRQNHRLRRAPVPVLRERLTSGSAKGKGGYQQKPCELLMLWKIKSWTFWILWERFCLRHLGNNAYLYCMKDVIIIFCELSLEITTICSDFLILFTNENHKRGPNQLEFDINNSFLFWRCILFH